MSTESKIIEQVEFYFSDSNLPNDRFLREIVANHPEGYVPIETIASFKRMQRITKDLNVVVNSLKKSKNLEVDKTGKLVRRTTPLPETNDIKDRSVFIEGLPTDSTIDSLKDSFTLFGKVNCVRIKKDKGSGMCTGAATVEFDKKSDLDKLIFFNRTIKLLTNEEKKELLQKRKEEKAKEKQEKAEAALKKDIAELKEKYKFESGSILRIEEIGTKSDVVRKDIRTLVESFGEIGFIDYPFGENEDNTRGVIRFKQAETVKKIMEKFNTDKKSFVLGGNILNLTVLTKDEEEEYFKRVASDAIKRKGRRGGKFGRKRKFYNKGWSKNKKKK